MSKGIFDKREQAFEAVFFARLDAERIEKLREQQTQEETMALISKSTGITDPAVLERILSSGINPHSLQALSLVPVVITAWASGEVTPAERDAALQAAEKEGVSKESGAHELLEAWLDEAPEPELEETWREYARAILAELDDKHAEALRQDLMSRCRQVARASGGILGLGPKISHAETVAMERLEEAMR
jgi:tellurite resistance protein